MKQDNPFRIGRRKKRKKKTWPKITRAQANDTAIIGSDPQLFELGNTR